MPPRLSKRLQREQEELEALGKTTVVADNWAEKDVISDQSEQRTASSSGAAIGFAALLSEGDRAIDAEETEEEEVVSAVTKSKKGKSKKKKKKASQLEAPVNANVPTQSQPQTAKTKTRTKERETATSVSKSGKQKAKEDDEFEKALAELSGKFSASNLSSPQAQSKLQELTQSQTLYSLLSVNLKNLDPQAELVRFFGSKVVASSGAAPSTSRTPRLRSYMAKQQSAWPPLHLLSGLSMRELTTEEYLRKKREIRSADHNSEERWWTIDASPRYKGVTYEYLQCVMGGDPQLFSNLLYEMPWHADTLLQVAEIFRHREEYSSASDLTARALFAYERSFVHTFNFTAGIHRLDFDHVENRVLYLALSRNVIDLNRRGTPQTAFEFARLLFGLDPYVDPHGSSLYLDSLAIKAKQHDWLLKMWTLYEEMGTEEGLVNVTLLPGWNWSKALALFEQEGDKDSAHIRSTESLKTAILTFPSVAPLLADKLDITIKEELRRLDCFKIITEYNSYRDDLSTSVMHLLSHIYVLRSFSIWKFPARANWFSKTLASIPISSFSSTPLITQTRFKEVFSSESVLTESFYRHVLVSSSLLADFRRLLSFFPSTIKDNRMRGTIEGDPLPPASLVTTYNDMYFVESGVDSRLGGDFSQRRLSEFVVQHLRRMFADGTEQAREMERLMQQQPQFPEIFPNGIDQFRRMIQQVPHEVIERMFRLGGDGEPPAEGDVLVMDQVLNDLPGMPGGLNTNNSDNVREEEVAAAETEGQNDDELEEEEDQQSFPMRMFRNLAVRIWRRSEQQQPEDGSDDDGSEVGDPSTNPADDVD